MDMHTTFRPMHANRPSKVLLGVRRVSKGMETITCVHVHTCSRRHAGHSSFSYVTVEDSDVLHVYFAWSFVDFEVMGGNVRFFSVFRINGVQFGSWQQHSLVVPHSNGTSQN